MNIFRKLLGCVSLTVIGFLAEEQIPFSEGSEKEHLRKISVAPHLDEAYALCHEALGEHEDAEVIRAYMSGRRPPVRHVEFEDALAA